MTPKEKQYQIRLTLNISTIRALLKWFNTLKLTQMERNRCTKFRVELEKILAEKEIEHREKKVPYHLS